METIIGATYGVEIVEADGPTGTFREVLHMDLRDFGGNVLQSGKPGSWAFEHCCWKIPVRRVATALGSEIGHALNLCDFADVKGGN